MTTHGIFYAKQPITWKKIPNKTDMQDTLVAYAKKFDEQIHRRIDDGILTEQQGEYLLQRLAVRRLTRDYGVEMELIPW